MCKGFYVIGVVIVVTSVIPYSLATYIIRCDNFMNIHITNSHVIFAILTQYR